MHEAAGVSKKSSATTLSGIPSPAHCGSTAEPRRRASGEIAFDDDPFELASLFVAMAEGEWTLRLATGMLEEITDAMIEEHARRVTRIFLKGLAPQ
jgi:hypothetical protein